MTVSRLDGSFGVEGLPAPIDPVAGALAGLAKTARHEWPEVECKAIDLDRALQLARDRRRAARRGDDSPWPGGSRASTETGLLQLELTADRRLRPGMGTESVVIEHGDVVVITGGAGGSRPRWRSHSRRRHRPRLVLLGRTPKPEAEPGWLAPLEGEAAILRALRDRADGSCSPQALNERLRQILAHREIRRNLERIGAAGSEVTYHAVDVRDRSAVRGTDRPDRVARPGPIRGLVHGAGVLADRRIEDQTDAQFAQVYDTKVEGLARPPRGDRSRAARDSWSSSRPPPRGSAGPARWPMRRPTRPSTSWPSARLGDCRNAGSSPSTGGPGTAAW